MEENLNKQDETMAVAEVKEETAPVSMNVLDAKQLNAIWKNAQVLSKSQLLPDRFKGKVEDVMLLMDLSARMNLSLFTLASQMYVVHGTPALTAQLAISLVNSSGRFTPLSYVFVGEPETREYGCYAIATRLVDNVVCKGTVITMGMVTDEGWIRNSKWKTMTDQMLMYRSATFFARTFCPDVLMGMSLSDELIDVKGEEKQQKQKTKITLDGVKPPEDIVVESEVE